MHIILNLFYYFMNLIRLFCLSIHFFPLCLVSALPTHLSVSLWAISCFNSCDLQRSLKVCSIYSVFTVKCY